MAECLRAGYMGCIPDIQRESRSRRIRVHFVELCETRILFLRLRVLLPDGNDGISFFLSSEEAAYRMIEPYILLWYFHT